MADTTDIMRSLAVENDMTAMFMTVVAFAYIVTLTPQIEIICNEFASQGF